MSEPWFDPNTFGMLFGAIGGGLGGTLIGAWGACCGVLAPRGKGRAWIIPAGWTFLGLGVLSLAFGIFALLVGQPYGIWYGPTLAGGLVIVMMIAIMPSVCRRYAQAEARQLQAEQFRAQ